MLNAIKNKIPDKLYLEMMYFVHFKRFFSFKNPRTLNEKLQWLKIYNRDVVYTTLVDKIKVKEYVAKKIGEEFVIPTLATWDNANDIDLNKLPKEFVLKCNHDSHFVFICEDKDSFDLDSIRDKLNDRLKFNMYWYGREWPYKNVAPKILAEKLLHPDDGDVELVDYKILCFNGQPDNIMVCTGRQSNNVRYYFFDLDWNLLRYQEEDFLLPEDFTLPKPKNLDLMVELAKVLSEKEPVVRVDFYESNNRVWFGELTFFPAAGFDTDITPEADLAFGEKILLPKKK